MESAMRESCIECVCKHIGQAAALMHEVMKGYEFHYVYIVGHLAEAEDEAMKEFPDFAAAIRILRKNFMKGEDVNIDALAEEAFSILRGQKENELQ
jgi:hypothetical protein